MNPPLASPACTSFGVIGSCAVIQDTTTRTTVIAVVAMLATTGCESCSNQSDRTSVPTQSTASASETTTTVAGTSSNRYLVSAPPVVSDPHHPGGKTVDGSGTSLHHRWSFTYEDARNSGDLARLFPERELFECCRLLGPRGQVSVRVHFDVRHGIARKRQLVVTHQGASDQARRSQAIQCVEHVYAGREVPASNLPTEFTLGLTCATPVGD